MKPILLTALLILAGCKSNPEKDQKKASHLYVKRVEVVTNLFLKEHKPESSGTLSTLIYFMPVLTTNHVTNLIIGTEAKDLFKAQAL